MLAERLGYVYIDTGAMYRAIGWKAVQDGIDPADEGRLADLCRRTEVALGNDTGDPKVYVDGRDVSGEIRTPHMGMMASAVSKSPAVRARLLILQRDLGRRGGVVMDGRDIGTVVFPDADVKIFLDASAEERGRRRFLELKAKGMDVDQERITSEIRERDLQDSTRSLAPLRKADDAVQLDSTGMGIDEVLQSILSVVIKVKRGNGNISCR
jgi:cytidylate kinase